MTQDTDTSADICRACQHHRKGKQDEDLCMAQAVTRVSRNLVTGQMQHYTPPAKQCVNVRADQGNTVRCHMYLNPGAA
jgi:hypothetical protein